MNLVSLTGHFHLSPGFEWTGSTDRSIAFGKATLVEVLACTIYWLDRLFDLIASRAAIIAGIIAAASV
jgi:hypothetical protein